MGKSHENLFVKLCGNLVYVQMHYNCLMVVFCLQNREGRAGRGDLCRWCTVGHIHRTANLHRFRTGHSYEM